MITDRYDPHKSLLLQLRDAARVEHSEMERHQMRECADKLDALITRFRDFKDGDDLFQINGLWALGIRLLRNAKTLDPAPGGSRVAVAA